MSRHTSSVGYCSMCSKCLPPARTQAVGTMCHYREVFDVRHLATLVFDVGAYYSCRGKCLHQFWFFYVFLVFNYKLVQDWLRPRQTDGQTDRRV